MTDYAPNALPKDRPLTSNTYVPAHDGVIGRPAAPFALCDQTGTLRSSDSFRGRWLVVFFYPKDDTKGCTDVACGFRDLNADFAAVGAAVVGISPLGVKSKGKFAAKNALSFPILADEDHAVCSAYEVWVEKSMYGRKFMGVSRQTFVVAPDGRVAMHWPKVVANTSHAGEVLEWLRNRLGKAPQ